MDCLILIRPAVDPFCRGDIEDYLLDHLTGFELLGGGTALGEVSESDIQLELDDGRSAEGWASEIQRLIQEIPVTEDTAWMDQQPLEFEIRIGDSQLAKWTRTKA